MRGAIRATPRQALSQSSSPSTTSSASTAHAIGPSMEASPQGLSGLSFILKRPLRGVRGTRVAAFLGGLRPRNHRDAARSPDMNSVRGREELDDRESNLWKGTRERTWPTLKC